MNDTSEKVMRMRVAGIVLCGGQSQRMGQAKAWLPFHGETMLARATRTLAEVVRPIVVVAAPDQEVPALADDVVIVRDEREGRGPLQGLAAGLEALKNQAEAAFLAPCDVPFLQPAFVQRLIELMGDHLICVPRVLGRAHPLTAVYRLEVLAAVRKLLDADRRAVRFLFDEVATRYVTEEEFGDVDAGFRSLQNVNTPEQYQRALASQER